MLKGAFRFTTGLAGKAQRRDVRFRVGAVTAGIRGTDIWGKSTDGTDLVLLLEGRIEMAMEGHANMMMEEPLHGVMMMPSGEMQVMDSMSMQQVQDYARETEMSEDSAMMMDAGQWQLVVMSLRNSSTARRVAARLVQAGYPAEVQDVELVSGQWHRVVLDHLASVDDARMQGEHLDGMFGVEGFWIRKETH